MAWPGPQPNAGVPPVPVSSGGSSSSSPTGAQFCCKDPDGASAPVKTPAVVEGPASCLPRNVLSERERRKRISVSCERLRALLPRFDGRREDMASVLEMSVQFLRLAGPVLPGGEQAFQVLPCSEEVWWHRWQEDALGSQAPAGTPDPGTPAGQGLMAAVDANCSEPPFVSAPTRQQDPPSCVTTGVNQGEARAGGTKVPNRPAVHPGPSSHVPPTPGQNPAKVLRPHQAWPLGSGQPASPLLRGEAPSCLGQAGPLTEGTDQAVPPGTRFVSGGDVQDGPSFPPTASPDWWLGSLEGRGNSALVPAPARSSPLDRTELGFLADPQPGSQELQDGPLEMWGWDGGCASLALRDEVDSIFPDFLAY